MDPAKHYPVFVAFVRDDPFPHIVRVHDPRMHDAALCLYERKVAPFNNRFPSCIISVKRGFVYELLYRLFKLLFERYYRILVYFFRASLLKELFYIASFYIKAPAYDYAGELELVFNAEKSSIPDTGT